MTMSHDDFQRVYADFRSRGFDHWKAIWITLCSSATV
jgi:uncharacterized protein (UPF0335 family)